MKAPALITRSVDAYLQGGREAVQLLAVILQGKCILWNRLLGADRDYQQAHAHAVSVSRAAMANDTQLNKLKADLKVCEQELQDLVCSATVGDVEPDYDPARDPVVFAIEARAQKLRWKVEELENAMTADAARMLELARIGHGIHIRQAIADTALWKGHTDAVFARYGTRDPVTNTTRGRYFQDFDGGGSIEVDLSPQGIPLSAAVTGRSEYLRLKGASGQKLEEVTFFLGTTADKQTLSEVTFRPAQFPGITLPHGTLKKYSIERLWDGDKLIFRLHFTVLGNGKA